jgi:hypothetical protein
MSRRAGLHPNQARRKGSEGARDLAAAQRPAQDDLSPSVNATQLEDVLCDIKADRGNLGHESRSSDFLDMPILAHLTLAEGALHDSTLT